MRSLDDLTAKLERKPPGSRETVKKASQRFGATFPADYVAFMLRSNGAEGVVDPKGYIQLWPIEEVIRWNEEDDLEYPNELGLIAFGSDGGGELYALDMRAESPPSIVEIPAVGERSDAIHAGSTLRDLLEYNAGTEPFNPEEIAAGEAAIRYLREHSEDQTP